MVWPSFQSRHRAQNVAQAASSPFASASSAMRSSSAEMAIAPVSIR